MRPVEVSLLSLNIRHLAGAQNACPAGSDFSDLQRASPSLSNGGLRPAVLKGLRGRCPLARFACLPRVRHVAGGWGKSTPSHQPKAWESFHSVKGAGCAPASSPVRCSVAALPALRVRLPVPPLTLLHSVPGQGIGSGEGSRFNGGDPPEGWGGNRSFLTPRSDLHAHGWGVGCAGRRPELPAPLPRGERLPSRQREGRGDGWCNDRREAQGEARRARPKAAATAKRSRTLRSKV